MDKKCFESAGRSGCNNDGITIYSDIFSRKWDYRYSSPQSYIDYFTQQVWNGDIEGAKRVGQQAEEYLKSIEAAKTSPVVDKIASALDYTPSGCNEKTSNFIYCKSPYAEDNRGVLIYAWGKIYLDICRKDLLYLPFYSNHYYLFGIIQIK